MKPWSDRCLPRKGRSIIIRFATKVNIDDGDWMTSDNFRCYISNKYQQRFLLLASCPVPSSTDDIQLLLNKLHWQCVLIILIQCPFLNKSRPGGIVVVNGEVFIDECVLPVFNQTTAKIDVSHTKQQQQQQLLCRYLLKDWSHLKEDPLSQIGQRSPPRHLNGHGKSTLLNEASVGFLGGIYLSLCRLPCCIASIHTLQLTFPCWRRRPGIIGSWKNAPISPTFKYTRIVTRLRRLKSRLQRTCFDSSCGSILAPPFYVFE